MATYYMGPDGKFREKKLESGTYIMNEDGTFSLKKEPEAMPMDTAAGVKPTVLPGAPAVTGPVKNDFAAKAGRHTLPVSPVTQRSTQEHKQAANWINLSRGISDETKAYDAVIEQMEADSERFTELTLFYDFYQKDPGQWSEPELAQQAKEKMAEYETYAKKYGTFDAYKQRLENLYAAREEAQRRNYMQADLMEFAKWDAEDQQMLYRGLQAYADNEQVLVGSIERALWDKYGKDTVKRIWESVEYSKGLEKLEAAAEAGQKSPSLANTAASLPVSWLGSLLTLPYRVNQTIKGNTGRYGANAYVPFSELGVWAENTQEATKQEMGNWVKEHLQGAGASEGVQNFAEGLTEFAFGAGVQIVDTIAKAATFGGVGTLALAATTTFEQSYREAAQSGAEEGGALAIGIAKAALEVLTEKIPLDNLLDNVKAGKSGTQAVIDALAQGGIEATTEEINFLGGLVAEAVTLRDKSGYQQMVRQAMAQGMDYAQAREYATQQLYLMAAETAATAFVAGAGSSGITSIATNMNPGNAIAQQAQAQQKGETQDFQTVGNEQEDQAGGVKGQLREYQNTLSTMKPVVNSVDGGQQEEQIPTFQEEVARQLGVEQSEQQPQEKLSYAERIRRAENNNNGGNTNATAQSQFTATQPGTGNGVSDGGSQRAAGMGAGEQTGGVAGSTGRTAQRTAAANAGKTAVDRQNRARFLRQQGLIQPTSSKSLGIPNGTEVQNISVLPEDQYDEELQTVAQRIKAETGKNVTFVVGNIQVRTPGGVLNVRGVRTADGIIVQSDNFKATATQIADHEAFHDKASWGLQWSVKQHITENYSEVEFRVVVDKYAAAMEGIIDIRDADGYEAFIRRVEEEVLADAYAGIDYRGFGATKLTEPVNEFMDQKGVGKFRQQDNGVRQTNAPPNGQNENTVTDDGVRYSFADIEDITPSQSVMNRNVRSVANMEPVHTVAEESLSDSGKDIKEIYREAFAGWGNNLYTEQFGDIAMMESSVKSEFAHGSTAQKIAAVEAIPSVIENGKIIDWFEKHSGLFRITVAAPIRIGKTPYIMGVMLQRDNQNQRLYLHDVIIEKEVSDLLEEHLSTTGPAKKDKNLFMTNILERVTDVKRKDAAYLDAVNRGDVKTAQRMVDEAAKAAGYTIKAYHGTTNRQEKSTWNQNRRSWDTEYSRITVFKRQYPEQAGHFFNSDRDNAGGYGYDLYSVFLMLKKPLVIDCKGQNYSNITYGGKTMDTYEWADYARKQRYDGVVFENISDGVGYDDLSRLTTDYVVFDSNRIKDAETVVYDNNHNVIPLSQRFNPQSNDIRYSLDDSDYDRLDAELDSESQRWRTTWLKDQLGEEGYEQYRENRARREAEQRAEQKLKDKEKRKVDSNRRKLQKEYRDSVADAAMNKKLREGAKPTEAKKELRTSILDMFSIPAGSKAEAAQIIDSYADRIIKNGVLTEADRKAFFDRMYAAGVMTVPADEYMALGRDAIRKGKIYVNESLRQELGDDWAELRRRAFGAGVYLTTNQLDAGVDVWNDDLAGILPGLFDSEETDQQSILRRIVQVAEEGRDEKVSLAEYTAQLAGEHYVSEDEILDSMERDLDTALRIFAKTAGIEIKVKEQAIKRQAALTKENYRQRLQAAQERQDRKEMAQRQQEQKQLKEMQHKTLKTLQWLSKNRNRAPEELKAAFDEVLSDLDIYAVGAANEMRWSDKHNATWKDLAQMYVQAKESDPNFLPSKELEIIVSRLNDRKIEDLDISALNDLYKAAVGLRTEFYNRNNVMGDQMNRLFEEVYADSKAEIQSASGSYTGKRADRLFNMDQLTPMNVLQRMGGWDPNGAFYSMARQLENGERDVRAFTVKANRMLEEFLTEHEAWVKKADGQGKDAIWYTIEVPELLQLGMGDKPVFGDTVKVHMTPAQKVHMYLESKNVDNLRHMTGGRTFADRELYSKGERKEAFAQGKTIRLAPETVKQIVSNLTAEEMELAQILDKFYNGFAKGEINRISNILYGYDKAMGKNYAPIFTNQNYVQSEIGIFDQTAEGVSNLKERQTAKNPSYNIGAFDAFERSVDQTARFVGMAIPARNWNSLLNWREMDNSMGDVITHKWGMESKKYIENLLTELQGGKAGHKEVVSETAEKLLSNYISSVFGFNPGIVLKQLGSIPLASAYLGSTNVPSVQQIRGIDRNLIAKYTQDLDWRSMGYSMPETKQLKDNPNWTQTNKVARFAIGGGAITAMDTWAASTLWPWAENKVHREHPELEMGTQAQIDAGESPFYKKVAEEFERAVSRSQSVADVTHQSTLRKSKGVIAKALTMFRSDSAQTYNTIRQKIGEAQYYIRSGADTKVIQDAKKAVGTTFLAALGNFLLAGLIDFLMNLWKRKGKNYRDEEGELTFQSVAEKAGVGILQSFAGIVVGGEELAELIGTALTGDRWYGVESTQVSAVLDLLQTAWDTLAGVREIVTEGADVVENGGDFGEYLRRNGNNILGSIKDTAKEVSAYLGGVPTGNIEAYMIGLLKHLIPGFDAAYEDAFATADKSELAGLEGQDIAVRIGSILSNRRASTSDETAQELAELYEAGYEGAVPGNTPTTVTIDGEQQKLSTYQRQLFDRAWSGIVGGVLDEVVASDEFREADPERQEKMLKTLFTYATDQAKHELFEALAPSSRADDIAAFESVGLGMPEFLRCYAEYTAINAEDLKAKEKATRFSRWVHEQGFTKAQINTITGNLAYFNMTPADAGKFESAVDSGMDIDDAYDLQEQMTELEPEEGKVQVSDAQRWRLCVDMSSNPAVQIAALRSYMSDTQIRKAEIACHFDIDLSDYVRLYEIRAEYDANGNKSYSQAEYKAAIDSLKLSNEYSGILWQLATGSKDARKNPYSREAGEMVLKVLE